MGVGSVGGRGGGGRLAAGDEGGSEGVHRDFVRQLLRRGARGTGGVGHRGGWHDLRRDGGHDGGSGGGNDASRSDTLSSEMLVLVLVVCGNGVLLVNLLGRDGLGAVGEGGRSLRRARS